MEDYAVQLKLYDNYNRKGFVPQCAKAASIFRGSAATRWCKAHRIPFPSGAAVLCFDDDPSLRRRGIASCIPDRHTIGYLMAHALIGDIPIRTSRHGFLRTPALLLQRRTLP